MPSKRRGRKPDKRWSIYPTLHENVAGLLLDEYLIFNFHNIDDDHGSLHQRDTNIMGRFTCHNNACSSKGWSSKQIAITIRMYPGQKYNARVYYQRCKKCNGLSKPKLDESYAERVVYWIKKWNGIAVERPPVPGESKGPHNSRLCEGCKAGHCRESRGDLVMEMERWVLERDSFCTKLMVFQIGYLMYWT